MTPIPLSQPLPKVVVFDLDYTLWPTWVDTSVDPPLKRRGDDINRVYDRHGQALSFYPEVPELLLRLHHSGVQIWAASRTHAPKVARQVLSELLLEGELRDEEPNSYKAKEVKTGTISASSLFGDRMEIYPGSKISHFRSISKRTGLPCSEMLFFDDEPRNREVTKLGVTFCLVPNKGTTISLFESGLEAWRKQNADRSG